MEFKIQSDLSKSKCNTCVHAHIIETFDSSTGPTVICTLLHSAIKPVKECNVWTPHINAPVPMGMFQMALIIDLPKKGRTMGFGGKALEVTPSLVQTMPVGPVDPEDETFEVIEEEE